MHHLKSAFTKVKDTASTSLKVLIDQAVDDEAFWGVLTNDTTHPVWLGVWLGESNRGTYQQRAFWRATGALTAIIPALGSCMTLTRDTFCVIHAIRNIFDPDGAERVMATRARFVTSFRTSPSTLSPSIVDQWGSPFNRLSMFVNRGVSFFETLCLPDHLHTVSSFGSDFQQILTIPGSALRLSFPPGTVTLIKGRIPFQVSQPTQPHAFVIERHPPSASPFKPLWDARPAEVSAVCRHFVLQWGDLPTPDIVHELHTLLHVQGWIGHQ
ncbi:hypothetical protein FA13DRAFT_1719546 [Coprinellus micaceus]|uniref:Uncharacterized protein n=1 Tax=Coprinellus micaceus TaxID=71717 RepID=A0A4Y7SBW8_COPMI|nr:hypothetical protein FA13DRAFT_1719546 [Coprinellus micaceus]